MQTLTVEAKFNNKKLSNVLYFYFDGLTKNTLYKALRKKDIRIDNKKISEDTIVHTGEIITIYIVDALLYTKLDIEKVYEDENILIVNKPSNLEVVGDNSLTSKLEKEYHSIFPCHRLDRNTTGLVLFAKNQEALDILLAKFQKQEIEKHYLAKVYGIPPIPLQETKHLTAYLFKDRKKAMVYISDIPKKGYVKIETSYTVLEKNETTKISLLDVELHTGRTHQIRAHLAAVGLPILGDGKYGLGMNEINKKLGFKTQQLCSYKIKFNYQTDAGILNYLKGKEIQIKNAFSK